jgi:hypothetical protein
MRQRADSARSVTVPIPITEALAEQVTEAKKKATSLRSPGPYLISGALAGIYIGVGVVLLIMASAPFNAANSPATKLGRPAPPSTTTSAPASPASTAPATLGPKH